MLKHCFLYCTMNEFTAIMKKDPCLVLNLLIFGFILPKKLMTPPIDCLKSEWPPLYAFIKNRWPPPIFCHPTPSAEIYEQSLRPVCLQPRLNLRAVLFSAHVKILCTQLGSPSETDQPKLDTVGRSFPNKIWQLLFSWPKIGVFLNGPMVKGFSEPGPVFQICRSLVGAAAIGCCEGSMIMSVLTHCEWYLSLAENVLWPVRWKGQVENVNVRQQSSKFKVAKTLADL